LKLGKKRRESSKRNYYIISPIVIIKAIIIINVTKMEVGRDVTGGLGSKSKKWELVVGDT